MFWSIQPSSGINVLDFKKVKYNTNMLEFARSCKYYNYCNFGILGILFRLSFCH